MRLYMNKEKTNKTHVIQWIPYLAFLLLVMGSYGHRAHGESMTGSSWITGLQNGVSMGASTYSSQQRFAACSACNSGLFSRPCPEQCAMGAQDAAQAGLNLLSLLSALTGTAPAAMGDGSSLDLPDLPGLPQPPDGLDLGELKEYITKHKEPIETFLNNLPPDVRETFEGTDVIGAIREATEAGWNVDLTTGKITGPEGVVDPSSLPRGPNRFKGLPSGMAEALKKKQEEAVVLMDKIASKAGKGRKQGGLGRGGAGGAASYATSASGNDDMFRLGGIKYKLKTLNKKSPASVKGLKKRVGANETIGVAGDSLFDMVTRRYIQMNRKNLFIKR